MCISACSNRDAKPYHAVKLAQSDTTRYSGMGWASYRHGGIDYSYRRNSPNS